MRNETENYTVDVLVDKDTGESLSEEWFDSKGTMALTCSPEILETGHDSISGGEGNDTIYGMFGDDTITGGLFYGGLNDPGEDNDLISVV